MSGVNIFKGLQGRLNQSPSKAFCKFLLEKELCVFTHCDGCSAACDERFIAEIPLGIQNGRSWRGTKQ